MHRKRRYLADLKMYKILSFTNYSLQMAKFLSKFPLHQQKMVWIEKCCIKGIAFYARTMIFY